MADGKLATHIQITPRDTGGNRQDTPAQRLAHGHNIGDDFVMLKGKHPSGFAEARGNLIHDQQGPMAGAGIAYLTPEPRRRYGWHGAHRLGNNGSHIALTLQHILHHIGTGLCRSFKAGLVIGTQAIIRRDMLGPRQ